MFCVYVWSSHTKYFVQHSYCCFSHSAYWLPTRKNYFTQWPIPLVVCWKEQNKKVWHHPPPHPPISPRCSFGEKIKIKITRRIYRRYAGLGLSRVRTRIPSTRLLGQRVLLRKIQRFRVREQFCQSRFFSLLLAMSSRVYLFFPPRGHELPPTLCDSLNPHPTL